MKDYSAMSDYLINQHVAENLTGRYLYFPDYVWDSEEESRFDPCNNPADAWPIIQERGISLNYDGFDWFATDIWTDIRFSNDIDTHAGKPMRAAMICYLMSLGAEKGHG